MWLNFLKNWTNKIQPHQGTWTKTNGANNLSNCLLAQFIQDGENSLLKINLKGKGQANPQKTWNHRQQFHISSRMEVAINLLVFEWWKDILQGVCWCFFSLWLIIRWAKQSHTHQNCQIFILSSNHFCLVLILKKTKNIYFIAWHHQMKLCCIQWQS